MSGILRRVPLVLATILAVAVALASLRFLPLGLDLAFSNVPHHLEDRRIALLLHAGASAIALGLGAFQFMPRLRARRPRLHRWTGRAYGIAILIGAPSGLVLAFHSQGGLVGHLGFGVLSVVWTIATAQAIRLAMAGQIAEHRVWMYRSYAMTFGAVMLRLQLPFLVLAGLDADTIFAIVAWTAWVPNLIFVEYWLNRKRRRAAIA